jgi:putative endonuclease
MKDYWVYILKCSDNSYYTGSTSNIDKRLSEHHLGFIKGYTKSKRPLKLVFSEHFGNPRDAVSAERQIKGWSRAKIEALINSDFDLLIELSKKKKSP